MPVAQKDERAPVEAYLDDLERWVLRHRPAVAPPLTAVVMWGSSALAYALTGASVLGWQPGPWPFWLYALLVIAVLLVFGVDIVHETEAVPLRGKDGPGEAGEARILNTRVASTVGWLFGAGWCVAQARYGPSGPLTSTLIVALVPAWVVWFKSRRVRRGAEVFRKLERWDGDSVGTPGLSVSEAGAKAAVDGSWWEAPLRSEPKGRWTAAAIRKVLPRIAARYEVDAAEMSIQEPRPGRFYLRYTKADPNEPPLLFEPPAEGWSVRQRATVGRWDDDGSAMQVSLYRDDHGGVDGLALGVKGGGKSNYEEITAAFAVAAKDMIVWAGDLKPGAQQWGPWAPALDWLATTPEEVDRMFGALLILMQVRGGSGGRIVKPSTKRPAILLLLDEGALYFNPPIPSEARARMQTKGLILSRISLVENVLATSRSFAVAVRVALQRATWDNVGGATIRGHLIGGEAAIFRTAKNEDARLAVDMTEDEAEVMRTSKLPRSRPGTCFIQNAESEEPRRGRIFKFTEADRDKIVKRYADEQPMLEQAAVDALGEDYANRQRTRTGSALSLVKDAPVEDDEPDDPPDTLPAQRMSEADALVLAWKALCETREAGASGPEVATRTGRSEGWARGRLTQLVGLGAAEKRGRRWIALGDEKRLRQLTEDDVADGDEPDDDDY